MDMERVACEVCLKEIQRSEAVVAEATGYVACFCGLECYEKWKGRIATPEELAAGPAKRKERPQTNAPGPGMQLGHDRGVARDERVKRLIKRHPQRDEPKLDSVEDDEIPPP
jgi:hypothetical protein